MQTITVFSELYGLSQEQCIKFSWFTLKLKKILQERKNAKFVKYLSFGQALRRGIKTLINVEFRNHINLVE